MVVVHMITVPPCSQLYFLDSLMMALSSSLFLFARKCVPSCTKAHRSGLPVKGHEAGHPLDISDLLRVIVQIYTTASLVPQPLISSRPPSGRLFGKAARGKSWDCTAVVQRPPGFAYSVPIFCSLITAKAPHLSKGVCTGSNPPQGIVRLPSSFFPLCRHVFFQKCTSFYWTEEQYLSLAELERALVPAHLQQLCDSLLIGRQAHDLLHYVPHKFDALAEPLHVSTHVDVEVCACLCQLQSHFCFQDLQLRYWHPLLFPGGEKELPETKLSWCSVQPSWAIHSSFALKE